MIFNFDRNELIKILPEGICAEVGVAKAKFSMYIHANTTPKMFYLIDAWKNFDLGYNDSNMVTQAEHNRRYSNAIRNLGYHDNIDIVRALSVEGASKFSDNTFDWVYIDADHSYNGCKDDLNAYKDKVKEDGYICGHDYLREGFELPGYGTNQAVDDFVSENNYFLTILTNEKKHKSYAISKNKESHERLLVKANQTQ